MELKDMTLEEVEARISELDSMVETSEDVEAINKATEERKALNERKAELKDLEERKAMAQAIENKEVVPEVVEERKEENTMKNIKEYRNSEEYINAFAEYIKTGDATECRALLTTNVGEAGEVAIPDLVANTIKTDWLQSQKLALPETISSSSNLRQEMQLSTTKVQEQFPKKNLLLESLHLSLNQSRNGFLFLMKCLTLKAKHSLTTSSKRFLTRFLSKQKIFFWTRSLHFLHQQQQNLLTQRLLKPVRHLEQSQQLLANLMQKQEISLRL